MKLPRRTISASGRGRCRAAGRLALRLGANLSDAAGAHHCRRRLPAARPTSVARLIGQWLSERLGQPFVIENRPGAGGQHRHRSGRACAAGRLYASLGQFSEHHQRNALRQTQFQFHPRHRADQRTSPASPSSWRLIHRFRPRRFPSSSPTPKANPGKINMASAGIGSTHHVAGELFKMMAGVDMVHVPYRGSSPALTDLLAGKCRSCSMPRRHRFAHIRAGKLRALAVTTATRSEVLPDVPTVGEFVPGYEASIWFGVGAPKNTPAEIVDKLNKEINAALADPNIKARLADLGGIGASPVRPPTSASSSPTKPRSGPRSFGRPTSRRSDRRAPADIP